eukprot:403351220
MTKFSQTMKNQQISEFTGNYVNYKFLKKKIKQCHGRCMHELNESENTMRQIQQIREKAKLNESEANEEFMQTVIGEIQREFFVTLEKEIFSVSNFYQQLSRNIIREVNSLLKNKDQWETSHDHFLNVIIENLTKIGNEIIEVGNYIELNMTAMRKILKKFDKQLQTISIPMSEHFLHNLMRNQQSSFVSLISHSVLYEVYMILDDCHKQLKKISQDRINKSQRRQPRQKTSNFGFKSFENNQSRSQARELSNYEELKQPLLEDQDGSQGISNNMIPEGLGSQHFHRLIISKLKILKNTIDIIEESLEAIKIASSFTLVSHQAQVMIDTYKEAESQEGLIYYLGQRRSQNNDDDNDQTSGNNSSNFSSFNLRTLNLNELKAQQLFLFGFGGSKVVHRKYIANFVHKQYWTQYYSKLIFISFLGMCFGPLVYLLLVYLNMMFIQQEKDFLLPGYLGLFVFTGFIFVLIPLFRRKSVIQAQDRPRTRSGQLFKTNTTSKYSLDSDNSDNENTKQNLVNQQESQEMEQLYYNQKLKEITELQGFWQKYGSYMIIVTLKFMQKLPLTFPNLSYVCFIYSAMGITALFVNMIVQRLDLQYQDRSILLVSLFAACFGLFFQIDLVNQGSLILQMIGFSVTFIGIEIMEVAIAALTAKFTPPNLQRGNLNPSFLLTFAGTIGRTLGCLIITLTDLGRVDQSELDNVTNYTFIPMLAQSYQYNAVSNPNLLQHQFQVNQEHTSLPQQMVDDSIQAKHYYSIRSVEDRALRDIQNLNNHQIQNQIKAQRCHTSQSIENSVLQNNLGKISQTILSPNQQFLQNISTHYSQIKKYETFLQDIKKLNSNFYPQNPQVQLVNNQINNQQSKFQDQHVNNSNMNFLLQNQPQERLLDSSSVFQLISVVPSLKSKISKFVECNVIQFQFSQQGPPEFQACFKRQDNSDIRIVYSQKEENTSKQRIASLDNSQMIQNHCQSQQYGDDLKNKDLLLQISDSRKNKLSIASIKTQEQSNVMINYKYLDLSTIQSETKQLNGKGSYAYNTSQLANLENMPIKASQLTFEQLLDKEMQRESICQNHVFNSSGNNLAEVECNLFDAQSKSLEFEPSQEVPKVDVVNLDESSISSYVRNGTQETNESTQNINSIAPKPFLKRGDGYVTNYVKINVDQTFRNSELRNESLLKEYRDEQNSLTIKSILNQRPQKQLNSSRGLYKILENDELVENIKQQEIQKIENEMSKLQKKMKNLLSGRDDKGSSKTLGHYNQTLIKSQQITKPKKVGDKNQQKTNKQVYSENYNQSNLPTLKNQTSISTLQQKNFKGKSSPRVIGKSQGCKDQSKTKNSNLRLTQNNQSISQVDRSDSVMSFESKEQQLQSSKAQKPQPHNTKTQLRHFSVHTKPSEENLIKSLLNIDQKYMLDSKPVKTKTWNEEGVIEIVYQDGTKEQQMVSGMSKRHYQDGTIILTMPNQDVKLIREDGSQVNIYAQKRPEDKSQSEQLTIIRSLYDV